MLTLSPVPSLLLTACLLVCPCLSAQNVIINEVLASNVNTNRDGAGETSDWIELHNPTGEAIDLTGWYLSDDAAEPDKFIIPSLTLLPREVILVWASGRGPGGPAGQVHANFRISSSGEAIYLRDATGTLVDQSPALPLPGDVSLGRISPSNPDWYIFTAPTPGAPNGTDAFNGIVEGPTFSHEPGFKSSPFNLQAIPQDEHDTIRFTLNGDEPSPTDAVWSGPRSIDETTVVRIRAFRQGALPSPTITASYLFEDSLTLPTFSLVVPDSTFVGLNGIYYRYWVNREVPLNAEYFTTAGEVAVNQQLGVKIHAGDGREQKSLRLYARGRYGKKDIEHNFFADSELTSFRRLVLRNAGNDGTEVGKIHVKDGYTHRLYQQIDPEYAAAAYQPVNVFVNGDYFGIYNLRERQDEYYMKAHFGYDCDQIDFLEYDIQEPGREKTICGDWRQWEQLKSCLIGDVDLSTTNCDSIIATIDQRNFIDYQIFEIWVGNQDWLNNNYKFWKPKDHGKWKWVLWDTEFGLGTGQQAPSGSPDFDFMRMALSWGGWGDDDHTWMLRNLVNNQEGFADSFATRYLDLLNTLFLPEYAAAELDTVVMTIEHDLPRQIDRWGRSQEQWDNHFLHTRDYVTRRAGFARQNMARQLGYSDTSYVITLDVSPPQAGRIQVNTITIDKDLPGWQAQPYPWQGVYFSDLNTQLTALAEPGYQFVRWEGDSLSEELTLNLLLTGGTQLTAVFEPTDTVNLTGLVINELMSSNATTLQGTDGSFPDWFELFNPTDQPINIAGAFVSDDSAEPLKWQIPGTDSSATTITPGGYLVLFADSAPEEGVLHVDFKLSRSGESLRLAQLTQGDQITIIDQITFPEIATDLTFGRLPNGGPNWSVLNTPTPGAINRNMTSIAEEASRLPFSIYPNPTAGPTQIDLRALPNSAYQLEVRDLTGQLQFRQAARGGAVIPLSIVNLPAGTYVVQLNDATGLSVAASVLMVQ